MGLQLVANIDKQYRYETKLFVLTNRSKNAAALNKIDVAKEKFVGMIYHDLLMFCYRVGLFHYEQRLPIRSDNLNKFFATFIRN